jgi:hypothetical protein
VVLGVGRKHRRGTGMEEDLADRTPEVRGRDGAGLEEILLVDG